VAAAAALGLPGDFGQRAAAVVATIRATGEAAVAGGGALPRFLVFSQWSGLLGILRSALRASGVGCHLVRSGAASRRVIAAFEAGRVTRDRAAGARATGRDGMARGGAAGPEITALLLSSQRSAAGLNLTAASHVVFADAEMSHEVTAQAVGRVHRTGQRLPCFVHTFASDGTAEAAVLAAHDAKQRAAAGGPEGGVRPQRVGAAAPASGVTVDDALAILDRPDGNGRT